MMGKAIVIPGYGLNNYEVHPDGRVVKRGRIGARGYIVPDKELKHSPNGTGYSRVSMNLEGKNKMYFVHRLVARCFVPNPDNLQVVNHKDGNKLNNRAENLEWVTSSENNRHAIRTGLKKPLVMYGEKNTNSRFTDEEVAWIRENYVYGSKTHGQCALAKRFGVTQSSIWSIVHNKTRVTGGDNNVREQQSETMSESS